MNYKKLDKMSLSELIELEKASKIICFRYENASRMYDGSIEDGESYNNFKKYNDFHDEVVKRMEKIIDDITK